MCPPSSKKLMNTMKKLIYILTIALGVTLLAACSKQKVAPKFKTLAIDTLIGNPNWGCNVEYRFATIDNYKESPVLESIELSNIDYFFELEKFEGNCHDALAVSLESVKKEIDYQQEVSSTERGWQFEISVESHGMIVDSLLNYSIYRSSYMGGAHGLYTVEYHNYSLNDGAELGAADIFGAERIEALKALIIEKIKKQYNVSTEEEFIAKGFYPEKTFMVTDNILIREDAVIFLYNPYDIGCYALGSVEVAVTRQELDAL